MKNNKKITLGFTLVELLGIIVLISILSLITLGLVSKVIDASKKGAFKSSSYGILEAAGIWYMTNSGSVVNDVEVRYPSSEDESILKIHGKEPDYGKVIIDSNGQISINLYNKELGACAIKSFDDNRIEVRYDYNRYECYTGNSEVIMDDLVSEGWLRMYLFYPEDSYERMWRLSSSEGIRSSVTPDETWQEYNGSIYIPIERASDVWISYRLDTGWVTVPPVGKLLVDISLNSYKVNLEKVKVNIAFEKEADEKLYKIGSGEWKEYTGEFIITENVLIQAKVIRTEKLYDDNGTLIGSTKLVSTDKYKITSIKDEEEVLSPPIITRVTPLLNESARIRIDYPSNAVRKVYKINYGGIFNYTDEVSFSKFGDIVTSYYYDATGKKSALATSIIQDKEILTSPVITPNTTLKTDKVTLTVSYPSEAVQKLYKIGNGSYKIYTGPFTVTGNYEIRAMYKNSILKESVEALYEVENVIGEYNIDDSIVPIAPNITFTPDTLTTEVTVSVEYPDDVSKKYVSIGNSNYKEYTGPFNLDFNTIVYAYYLTQDDDSLIATKKIDNIIPPSVERPENKNPYVSISVSPSTYGQVSSVSVKLTSLKATEVLYSLDGINYSNYTEPFTVTKNCTVYALAINSYGEYNTAQKINNIGPNKTSNPISRLSTKINATPDLTGTKNKTLEVLVDIEYDSKATIKKYRLEGSSNFIDYTGPFLVTKNMSVIAYASNGQLFGDSLKEITGLYEGMFSPKISTRPNNNISLSTVEVSINYDNVATSKKYKINNGEWKNYTGSFEVTEECTVYAESSNAFEEKGSTYNVVNIMPPTPKIVSIDKGKYFLIKLNYPDKVTGQEYKYKENGTWKEYPTEGIILVKSEYKDELVEGNKFIVKIENENGQYVKFEGDWYVLDTYSSEIRELLFMRWDSVSLYAPTYFVDSNDIEAKVNVNIIGDRRCAVTEYKKTEPNTTESNSWTTYTSAVEVTKNNTVIKGRCKNSSGTYSSESSYKVINVDNTAPIVSDVRSSSATLNTITTYVTAIDEESEIAKYEFSINGGNYINNGISPTYKFTGLTSGTSYTIKVRVTNYIGMYTEKTYTGSTITLVAPTINVTNESVWKPSKSVYFGYPANQTSSEFVYKYQINDGEWQDYIGAFELTENSIVNTKIEIEGTIKTSTKTINYIDSTVPTLSLSNVDEYIVLGQNVPLPTSYTVNSSLSSGTVTCITNGTNYTNASTLPLGTYLITCTVTTGAGVSKTEAKSVSIVDSLPISSDTLYSFMNITTLKSGSIYNLTLSNGENIKVEYYKVAGDIIYSTTPTLCDITTDTKMCVIKYTGNVTVNSGITITPQVRKKGFVMYVDGTLTNNGTISMTARGAAAIGQDVRLYKNSAGTYEYIPAVGAAGGVAVTSTRANGNNGYAGITVNMRASGGGGSGSTHDGKTTRGGFGTSYSGGSGGAGSTGASKPGALPSDNGGSGGRPYYKAGYWGAGGTGNPGGVGSINGTSGTGGLLIIYANNIINSGIVEAEGVKAATHQHDAAGSSGGGIINIFHKGTYLNTGSLTSAGGVRVGSTWKSGGAGGAGSITIGSISTGNFIAN